MKKSLLFGLLITAAITFGVLNSNNKEIAQEGTTNTAFAQKLEHRAEKAGAFFAWRNEMLKNVETGEISTEDYINASKEIDLLSKKANKTETLGLNWISRGPDNQGGRTRTMLFDKNDSDVIYTGSVSGGLFKSENSGNSWSRISSYFLNNSAVNSLSQGFDGSIYVGTGEYIGTSPDGDPFTPATTGSGIYRSNDNGLSWASLEETNPNYNNATGIVGATSSGQWTGVSYLASHPTNKDILYGGTKSGLRISSNATAAPDQVTFSNANTSPSSSGGVTEIKILPNGQEGWAAIGGRLYKTNDPISGTWNRITTTQSNGARVQIAISTLDSNGDYTIYASYTNGSGCLAGVDRSEDKGVTWTQIIAPGGLDPFAQPTGAGNAACQGWYDHCLEVNPMDKDKIYIGGITFYTWSSTSGGLTRADRIGSEGGKTLDPDYIHADKHGIFFDPSDATGNTMYITSDGGISRTLNALTGFPDNMVYSEQNRDYITFQCYTVGSGKYGEVVAGGQDNGTQYVDYKGISPRAAKRISGGDGVAGAEVSNLSPNILFSGVYYGALYRSITNGDSRSNFLDENIDVAGCGHITCTTVTPTSNCDAKEEEGQNFVFPFFLMETYDRLVKKPFAVIKARDEVINLPGGGTVIIKDTIEAGEVIDHDQFQFTNIPNLDKEGLGLSFNLDHTLYPGEEQTFDNPFDAKFFVPTLCGNNFFVCTNPLDEQNPPKFSSINLIGQSAIKRMEQSKDGDMLVAVTSNGRVFIMQGWDAYHPDSASTVTSKTVLNVAPSLSGVSVDVNNKDRVLVTAYGYGGTNKIFLCENATSLNPTFTPVQGDLPVMPVYDCVIDKGNPDRFIVGTEFGIFASNDGGASWTAESTGLGARMPVYSVRQEWVNNFDCYLLSASALGGGMYTCETVSSCAGNIVYGAPNKTASPISKIPATEIGSIVVYPNPVVETAKIAFNLSEATDVTINIVDLTGKVVLSKAFNGLSSGKQAVELNVSDLASSTYFTVLSTSSSTYGNKLFIKK